MPAILRRSKGWSDRGNRPGERAFELIEGCAGLQWSDGVDEISDRFGLHQIHSAVEKRAKGEFARLGEARAALDRRRHDGAQHHRASMRAQFHDIVSRVRRRSGEIQRDSMIDRVTVGAAHAGRDIGIGGRLKR